MSGVCKPNHVTRLDLSALRLRWCYGAEGIAWEEACLFMRGCKCACMRPIIDGG